MTKITPAQMKKIYALAKELGYDNDLLHAIVIKEAKKEHISDLTIRQAGKVIDRLAGCKTKPSGRSINTASGSAVPLATDAQMWKIKDLTRQLGWQDNPKRLRGFCKKYAGIDNPDWMTKQQAWRIIEGLKSLLKQQVKTPGGGEDGGFTDKHMG